MLENNTLKLNLINNLEDSFKFENTSLIFRCPTCNEIPFVIPIIKDNIHCVRINCRNKCLINPIKQKEYYNIIKEKSIYNFKECSICKEEKTNNNSYYVDLKDLQKKKIICQKCLSQYNLEDKFKTININKFDSTCLKHNSQINSYCKVCNKDCCMFCVDEEHKIHKVSSILELNKNFNLEEIEKNLNNYETIKTNLDKMKKIFEEIEISYNNKKKQFLQAIKDYEKNIEIINFYYYAYFNFKILNIQKNYNYEMIFNISNFKSLNINEFHDSQFDNEIVKLNKMIKFLNNGILNNNLKDKIETSIIPTGCSVNYITQLFSGDIAVASYNSYLLQIYKNNTYEKIFSQKIVYCKFIQQLQNGDLFVLGDKFYIFSIDYNNINNNQFLKIKNPIKPIDPASVLKIYEMNNNKILISKANNYIYLYNINDYDLITNKNYLFYDIIQINNNEIIGKNPTNLVFLKINYNDIEETGKIQNINCNISLNSMCLIENNILCLCGSKSIYIIDLTKKEIIINLETNLNYSNIIKLFNGNILIKDDKGVFYEYQYHNRSLIPISTKKLYGSSCFYQLLNQQLLIGYADKIIIYN